MYKSGSWKFWVRGAMNAWPNYRRGIYALILLSLLWACQQKAKTKTVSVPVDTTVFDDDTLEVDDSKRQPPALAH